MNILFVGAHPDDIEIANVRHQEAKNAAAIIIGAELIWLGFDDEFLIDSV